MGLPSTPETGPDAGGRPGPGYDPGARGHSQRAFPSGCGCTTWRHTCASLLIREGATVKAVQAQLGHATASITLDTYGHLFPDELDQLASRLEAARAEARQAARVWPQSGPTVVQLSEGAGQ